MSDVTAIFLYLVSIYSLGSLQFGYHIGELNTPQAVISCQIGRNLAIKQSNGFMDCISMTEIQYGTIVSLFPFGGLFGSFFAGRLADRYGRRPLALLNCLPFILGPLLMSTANTKWSLGLGRILCGVSSGTALVLGPIYLNEISPIAIRGTVGVMTQLSCVVGILISQLAGVYLSTAPEWRYILAIGGLIGCIQFVALWFTVESPKWLSAQPGKFAQGKALLIRLRGRADIEQEMRSWQVEDEDEAEIDDQEEAAGLLAQNEYQRFAKEENTGSIKSFLLSPAQRPALKAVVISQLASQFTGINAVIFYSTSILATLLPELSAWISVGISIVNLTVTLAAAHLIEKTGRKPLLLISLAGMSISSLLLAVGMNSNLKVLSGISTMCIVGSFGIGLGPIPFLLISEYFEVASVGMAQSIGLVVNWSSTFAIGFFFPIMKQHLGGSSFYVFSASAVVFFWLLWRYVPESRGKTPKEVWQ